MGKKFVNSDSLKAITWTFFRKEFKEYNRRDYIGHRFIFLHYIYVRTRIFSISRYPSDNTRVLIYKRLSRLNFVFFLEDYTSFSQVNHKVKPRV